MKSFKVRLAFALVMGAITTALISFTLISVNIGFGRRFITTWLRSWAVSYVLAVALMITIAPLIQHMISRLFMSDMSRERKGESSI